MAAAVGLRNDYGSGGLQAAAKRSKDGPQARRLLALAAIYDGATRTEAAKIGGIGLQVVRDRVVKFNAQGPDDRLIGTTPGQPPRLNDVHRAALAAIIESGPDPRAIHGVVRWRIVDLCQWIFEEFRIVVSEQTLSRVLLKMDYRKLSARPRRHHAQAEAQLRTLKKSSRAPGRDQPREGHRAQSAQTVQGRGGGVGQQARPDRLGDYHYRRGLPHLHLRQGLILIWGNALERRTQAQEFGERDEDVMNDTARRSKTIGHSAMGQEPKARPLDWEPRVVGLHQGQRTQSAPRGRTYDRRPPAVHRRNKNACQGAVHI